MKTGLAQRLTGLACDAGVVFLFGCVLIGAGHGVAPVGLLMFASPDAWGTPMAVGWLAVAGLVVAALIPQRGPSVALTLLGLTLLVASWGLFVSESASLFSSVLFSIPFLAALAGRLVFSASQTRSRMTA